MNRPTPTVRQMADTLTTLLRTKGWTKNVFARNAQGIPIPWHKAEATSFCLIGAERRAQMENNWPQERVEILERSLIKAIRKHFDASCGAITNFNDKIATKADVFNLLRIVGHGKRKCLRFGEEI